jgi:redox-sensing transcriptional repressor
MEKSDQIDGTIERSRGVSMPTLRRLPLYHRYLKEVQAGSGQFISCTQIGEQLHLDPVQVRKDVEATGIVGRPKVGYPVAALMDAIEEFLGWKNLNEAFLVGAGSLGAALLGYTKFQQHGLSVVAAFDADPDKIGTQIHGKRILGLDKLLDLGQRMHIHIGIITVPAPAAQAVADLLVEAGIRAIWNFAPTRLRLPERIIVHNEDLYCSLAALSQRLAQTLAREKAAEGVPTHALD